MRRSRARHASGLRVLAMALIGVTAFAVSSCGREATVDNGDPLPPISTDSTLASQVPSDVKADGILSVATDPSYEPMEFVENGQYRGLDIDLARSIAKLLGLRAEFNEEPYSTIAPSVSVSKYELGMSSLWADDPDSALVAMVTYLNAGTQLAVQSSLAPKVKSDNDLCGLVVAVEEGTEQVDHVVAQSRKCVARGKPKITIKPFLLQADATDAIQTGKVQAMIADSPVVTWAAATSNGAVSVAGPSENMRPYGIAANGAYEGWAATVQQAVQKLIDGGQYAELLKRWSVSEGAIKTSQLIPPRNAPKDANSRGH